MSVCRAEREALAVNPAEKKESQQDRSSLVNDESGLYYQVEPNQAAAEEKRGFHQKIPDEVGSHSETLDSFKAKKAKVTFSEDEMKEMALAFGYKGNVQKIDDFIMEYDIETLANTKINCEIDGLVYPSISLFWLACRTGKLEVVELLYNGKPDINERVTCSTTGVSGRTPLFIACLKGHYKVIEFLLNKKADHTLKDFDPEKQQSMGPYNAFLQSQGVVQEVFTLTGERLSSDLKVLDDKGRDIVDIFMQQGDSDAKQDVSYTWPESKKVNYRAK
ncbi:ankyrin repeat domain-containing protein [Parashewanella curva]|nr:ankyrin repeat domain-containing protein [Parashewanella curva]